MYQPTEAEIAWFSGVFEGEGSIYIGSYKGIKKYVQVKISMSDRDTMERIHKIAGCGNLKTYQNYTKYPNSKPMHSWVVSDRFNVARLLEMMMPWLSERRTAKAIDAFLALECNEGLGFNQFSKQGVING